MDHRPEPTNEKRATVIAALALVLAGCNYLGLGNAQDQVLHDRAQQVLDRWAQATASAASGSVVIAGDLTSGGGWDGPNAGDQKIAFLSGVVDATPALPTSAPAPGQVVWADGTTQSVALLSAAEALQAMTDELAARGGDCSDCQSLHVTAAELISGVVDTPRGPATAPLWQFEWAPGDEPIDPITYVAIRDLIVVAPLKTGAVAGIGIDRAYGNADSSEVTVEFVGSPYGGDNPCGADYTAEAVESDLAIVVIVHESHAASGGPQPCAAVGATRTATASLSAPMGERVVLDIQDGAPVPVSNSPAPSFPTR
jgi:hypothetical protein